MPADLVIDLGTERLLAGFKYFPDPGMWASGIIADYAFFVSVDGESWQLVSEGEFSNIKNNRAWQIRHFPPAKSRYIKLSALRTADGNDDISYAEVDVITK